MKLSKEIGVEGNLSHSELTRKQTTEEKNTSIVITMNVFKRNLYVRYELKYSNALVFI